MEELLKRYESKRSLNLRTFYHCLNIRYSNEEIIIKNNKEISKWKNLVKIYIVKNIRKKK
jgi:hypothetical protein